MLTTELGVLFWLFAFINIPTKHQEKNFSPQPWPVICIYVVENRSHPTEKENHFEVLKNRNSLWWPRGVGWPRREAYEGGDIYIHTHTADMGFPGDSVIKNPPTNAGEARDMGSIPELGGSPGGGNSNPLQYSCLENSMDWGAWWATVHGVAESDMTEQLSTGEYCQEQQQGWRGCQGQAEHACGAHLSLKASLVCEMVRR